jgi:hypothetical protein
MRAENADASGGRDEVGNVRDTTSRLDDIRAARLPWCGVVGAPTAKSSVALRPRQPPGADCRQRRWSDSDSEQQQPNASA